MVLAPEVPVAAWFTDLDEWIQRSPGFFQGRPVVLDVSNLSLSRSALADLLQEFSARGIRIMGLEGADLSGHDLQMPPVLRGGRRENVIDLFAGEEAQASGKINSQIQEGDAHDVESAGALLIETPVRSGQSIMHLEGDVIVVGSVASGAEIIAGGSIHIYGALRGRAIAGAQGRKARIFCRKFEAELLSIDGYYMTADTVEPHLLGRPVQVWLEGDRLMVSIQD
nr:septum site-determining protein MinC [Beijerinckia indica]